MTIPLALRSRRSAHILAALFSVVVVPAATSMTAGCGSSDTAASETSTSDLTSSTVFENVCLDPVPSDDGKYALLYFCENGSTPSRLARLELKTRTLQTIANGLSLDLELAVPWGRPPLGAKNEHFYVIHTRPGGWSIELHTWDLSTSKKVDVESLVPAADPYIGKPSHVAFTADSSTLIVTTAREALPLSETGRTRAFVVPFSGSPGFVDIGSLEEPKMTSAPDSKSVLLNSGSGKSLARLDLPTRTLSPIRTGEAGAIYDDSFDGKAVALLWQDGKYPDNVRVLGVLNTDTGKTTEIVRDTKAHTGLGKVLGARPGTVDFTVPTATKESVIMRSSISSGALTMVATVPLSIGTWFTSRDGKFAYFETYDSATHARQPYRVAMSAAETATPVAPVSNEAVQGWTRYGDLLIATAIAGNPKDDNDLIVQSGTVDLSTGVQTPRDTLRVRTFPVPNGLATADYGVDDCMMTLEGGVGPRGSRILRFDGKAVSEARACSEEYPLDFVAVPASEAMFAVERLANHAPQRRVTLLSP